ncbi:hypothetical protein AB0I81_40880 [Nonomuraea sp. NPDC050404]|uniref:hypothetical protein n=1 Tax=Nonomuraea sp. NPDC050404 TaxID=3155783 RepID=UPI00341016F4
MIRRILAGAAIAAAAIGVSATAASADLGPNTHNEGANVASQFQIADDVLNNALNNSLHDIEVNIISLLDEVNASVLNNNQPTVGDHNVDTDIDNGHSQAR